MVAAEAEAVVEVRYDGAANAMYVKLARGEIASTREIDDSANVDLDADGKLLGIEVLSPGCAWPLDRIIREYEIGRDDARTLMMAYPGGPSVSIAPVAAR